MSVDVGRMEMELVVQQTGVDPRQRINKCADVCIRRDSILMVHS